MQKSERKQAQTAAGPQNIQHRTFEFACRVIKLHDVLHKQHVAPRLLSQLVASGQYLPSNLLAPIIDEPNELIAILATIVKSTKRGPRP
jgi:hypothetical protein